MNFAALLEAKDLSVVFDTARGELAAVDRLSFSIAPGETLGIVGESGSGKSVTSLAVMGLLAPNARVSAKALRFGGKDLLTLGERERQRMRGGEAAMIFQDPMTSLNPCYTVEFQISEALSAHSEEGKANLRTRVVELLNQVGIPDPVSRLGAYPHQLSGGMSQRVMIAMAMACSPKLLIADEPTTALDVTIQAQILRLITELQKKTGMALILITHDIGVVAETSQNILVMYAGQGVEFGKTADVIRAPRHPYTRALLASLPGVGHKFRERLPSLQGMVPDLARRPQGCQFHPRCEFVKNDCREGEPMSLSEGSRLVKCVHPLSEAR